MSPDSNNNDDNQFDTISKVNYICKQLNNEHSFSHSAPT